MKVAAAWKGAELTEVADMGELSDFKQVARQSDVAEVGDRLPRLSIIIPTFNRALDLRPTLDQLRQQSASDWELWVVDQSDPEDARTNAAYVSESGDDRLHYLHLDTRSLPNARNEGLSRVRGEIVLFVDDDVVLLSNNFVAAHMQAFDDLTVGGVTGRHVERQVKMNARKTACHVSWGGRTVFNLFGNERQNIGSCKGSNMSYRMEAVRQIGGFDRRTSLLEDTDFSVRILKAGWRLVFEPKAELLHLSTPAGGVREMDALATECSRFHYTAYYVLKHRGLAGLLPFLATFGAIALTRVLRHRSISVLPRLLRSIGTGFAAARLGPDQTFMANPVARGLMTGGSIERERTE